MIGIYLSMYLKYLAAVGIIYTIKELKTTDQQRVKRTLRKFISNRGIVNDNSNLKAYIEDIESEKWGFKTVIDISNVIGYEEFEKHQDYIKQLFRAKEVTMSNHEGKAIVEVITKSINDLEYKPLELLSTELLLGYDYKGNPIIVDMLKTPHMGVQGASNSGKSKGIELGLKNLKGADIVLLNVFEKDFTSIEGRRINGNENILKYLQSIIDKPYIRSRPLYLILDELNVLGKDKAINKAIMDVLSQARHFNIYLIALGQSLLKENCPYKQLFNVRVTFRAIDKSSISAFLGCNIEDTNLIQREFICYSDNIYRGKTYLANFE